MLEAGDGWFDWDTRLWVGRSELDELRTKNEDLMKRIVVKEMMAHKAHDKADELQAQIKLYESPFEEGRNHSGLTGSSTERQIKLLKGEVFRHKQREEKARVENGARDRLLKEVQAKLATAQEELEHLKGKSVPRGSKGLTRQTASCGHGADPSDSFFVWPW